MVGSGEGPERWHKGMYGYRIGSKVTRVCLGMKPGKHELVIPPFPTKLVQLWKLKCNAVIFSLPEDPVLHNLWLFSFFLKLNYSWFTMLCKFLLLLLLFSCSVVSDYLWLHGLQHARPPSPSPSPRACSNSCPLSQWCCPTILSSVTLLFSYLQSFPASRSFPVSQLFASGSQPIGASASASVLPMISQGWLPLGLIGLISLESKGLSSVFSNTIIQKHQFFGAQPSLQSNSHIHTWLVEKP